MTFDESNENVGNTPPALPPAERELRRAIVLKVNLELNKKEGSKPVTDSALDAACMGQTLLLNVESKAFDETLLTQALNTLNIPDDIQASVLSHLRGKGYTPKEPVPVQENIPPVTPPQKTAGSPRKPTYAAGPNQFSDSKPRKIRRETIAGLVGLVVVLLTFGSYLYLTRDGADVELATNQPAPVTAPPVQPDAAPEAKADNTPVTHDEFNRLNQTVKGVQRDVMRLDERRDVNEKKIAQLNTNVAAIQTDMAAAKQDIATLRRRQTAVARQQTTPPRAQNCESSIELPPGTRAILALPPNERANAPRLTGVLPSCRK